MEEDDRTLATRFVAVATIGIAIVSRQLVGQVLEDMRGADQNTVAEETLCALTAATIEAASRGFEARQELAEIVLPVLRDIPKSYVDYLAGARLAAEHDRAMLQAAEAVHVRLERSQAFYDTLSFTSDGCLLETWMGRISPDDIEESAADRLARLDLVHVLETHVWMTETFARHLGGVSG